jgi:CheY-like chemotaxis protein
MSDNNSIELILMDIKMPIMNGFEATKEIRKTNKSIPIIAQTAYAMEGDKQKALDIGCNDYIAKPIVETLLAEIMKKYLKRS